MDQLEPPPPPADEGSVVVPDSDEIPKRFMDADEVRKKAILDEMSTVMDMQRILPEDLKTWDKPTASQVLEKAFELCGVPRRSEGGRSTEDVQSEQLKLGRQLEALKEKKAKNTRTLQVLEKLDLCEELKREIHPMNAIAIRYIENGIEEQETEEDRRELEEELISYREVYADLQNSIDRLIRKLRDM